MVPWIYPWLGFLNPSLNFLPKFLWTGSGLEVPIRLIPKAYHVTTCHWQDLLYVELLFWKAKLNRIQLNQIKDVLSAFPEVFRNDWALCNCTALIVDCGTIFLNNFRDFSQNTNFLVNFIVKSKSFLWLIISENLWGGGESNFIEKKMEDESDASSMRANLTLFLVTIFSLTIILKEKQISKT